MDGIFMLFDADAVCRAAFCREVAQGAGPRLHDAALCPGRKLPRTVRGL